MEGIIGPMFAGKTSALLQRIEHARIAGKNTQVVIPSQDKRYGEGSVVTHDQTGIEAHVVTEDRVEDLLQVAQSVDVVGIDEVQFFPQEVVPLLENIRDRGVRVMYAGLNMNFRGEPFNETMKELLPRTDDIMFCTAVCTYEKDGTICGDEATRTQRLLDGKPAPHDAPLIDTGGAEKYEARCPDHHFVPQDQASF